MQALPSVPKAFPTKALFRDLSPSLSFTAGELTNLNNHLWEDTGNQFMTRHTEQLTRLRDDWHYGCLVRGYLASDPKTETQAVFLVAEAQAIFFATTDLSLPIEDLVNTAYALLDLQV